MKNITLKRQMAKPFVPGQAIRGMLTLTIMPAELMTRVPGGQFEVTFIDAARFRDLVVGDGPYHFCRDPHGHAAGRNSAALGDHAAGGDQAFLADFASRQQSGADADKAVFANAAAVQHRGMTDDHALLDHLGAIAVGVDDAAVLQIDPCR